jgi:ACR3 family arsenite transporter
VEWFERAFLTRFAPVTIVALLATLVLFFAFQAENITTRWFHVLLIAVPILLQVYSVCRMCVSTRHWFDSAAPA